MSFDSCAAACSDCAVACDQCAAMAVLSDDRDSFERGIALCLDTAHFCRVVCYYIFRRSEFTPAFCDVCALLVEECEKECRKQDGPLFRACGDACHHCADECLLCAAHCRDLPMKAHRFAAVSD